MGQLALKQSAMRGLGLLLVLWVSVSSACEIAVTNVGKATFTFHMEYAGGNIHEAELSAGAHDNYSCTCLPHYMNCIDQGHYQVEVTDHAIYINVGNKNVEMCV